MTDIIYSLIYLVPLILISASELMAHLLDLSAVSNPKVLLITMLLFSLLLSTIVNVKNKARVIIIAGLAALVAGVFLVTEDAARREWFKDNSWIWTALIVTALVVVLEVLMIKLRPVKLGAGILLLGVLISSYWSGLIYEKISVVSIVFLSLTILTEEIRRHKRGSNLMNAFIVRIAPFLMLGMISLYFLPHSNRPYDWALAKRIINNLSDKITGIMQWFEKSDSIDDMMSTLGFSEDAKISGNLSQEPEEMMTVAVGHIAPSHLYMDGIYFEDFDGREWKEAAESYPYMMDVIETSCTLALISDDKLSDYRKIEEITVTYSGQNTHYIFAPAKTYASEITVDNRVIDYKDNEILTNKKCGYNTTYKIKYLLLNRKSSLLPTLYELGSEIDKNLWNRMCARFNLKDDAYSYQSFLDYRRNLYDNSLCPNAISRDNLSAGVLDFLSNATDGANTDYEKLVALEEAFAEFEYTTSPGALPDEIDTPAAFLDYFVLNSKKGYCNSFATAFVLLCQAEGIPARYVHGYLVPTPNGTVSPVYSSMAHAYVEAYVKGIGWMVFDPTPGSSTGFQWDERGDYVPLPPFEWQGEPGTEDFSENEKNDVEEDTNKGIHWYVIVIPIVFFLLVLVFIIFVERAVNLRRYERSNKEEKAYTICLWIMKMLKYQGFVKADYETVSEYASRAFSERGICLTYFSKTLEKVLYSTELLKDNELTELSKEYDEVYRNLAGKDKVFVDVLRFLYLC